MDPARGGIGACGGARPRGRGLSRSGGRRASGTDGAADLPHRSRSTGGPGRAWAPTRRTSRPRGAELLQVLDARSEELPRETRDTVSENLEIIGVQIAAISEELSRDPDNQRLARLLAAAYQQELELLQKAAALPSARRPGPSSAPGSSAERRRRNLILRPSCELRLKPATQSLPLEPGTAYNTHCQRMEVH